MKLLNSTSSVFFIALAIALTGLSFNLSYAEIAVSDIRALVVEKGNENYSISVQAKVTNLGETDNITVAVIAVDMNGYQLKDVFLNGRIEKGKTKILNAFVQIPKKTYEDIFNWEWRTNK
ncbi:MAG: hypothetical protein MUE70_05900 [Desulfobacterales bacterium]|jgi:hypothetical protein|nr:hypothetical protein [Desulfobacterales bacterium]